MTQSTASSAPGSPLPPPKERRRLREARSLTEAQLAAVVGVTKATLRSWETGRTSPRGRKREAYAKVLAAYEAELAGTPGTPGRADRPEQTASAEPTARPEPAAPAEPPEVPTAAGSDGASGVAAKAAPPLPAAPGGDATSPGPAAHPVTNTGAETDTGAETATATATATAAPREAHAPGADLTGGAPLTPEEAFDLLYTRAAAGLVRQTFVLTGRRRLAHRSVEHAFRLAWQRWPEVATDRDPTGWVRAAAYEYAMSPWHRLRPAHRHPDEPPADAARSELLTALHTLPPACLRTLLLYDGLGLDLPETAAETEASTPAAAARVLHAREAVAGRVPRLAAEAALQDELRALATGGPDPAPPPAREVRTGCERSAEVWTRVVVVATALIAAATVIALLTSPGHYEPPMPPTRQVEGVPAPHSGPERLTAEDRKLRDRLAAEPAAGPERLLPGLG
ncbi:helix-turn-helix domain-containing protein [Streptomyces genisteinicus]|uniref:Helix-turn-helix domain-containing protein n=1 Tax=Streptomyces genisteinicus TaxID=2768068 RepID=A0A7H0HWC1_9ACTN|nr:helix-turn-helix domain-containing protein [Streptomyces genisteinicus]QNP64837.1 helix-turn-helix domain-containing protein [Streptomyces genisteinicus]